LSRYQKKGKDLKEQAPHKLLVVLCRLIIVSGLLIIIIVINTSRTNTKNNQLRGSQQVIGVGNGWVDRDVRELKKCLIPLVVNDHLVAPNNL
jgi:hypothetical protein